MIQVVILKTHEDEISTLEVKTIENDLQVYYDIIGCRCIDMPSRKIGKHYYDIIVDDEGLLQDKPIISAVNNAGDAMLVGTLIVCQHDEKGNTIGLTNKQVEEVKNSVRVGLNMRTGKNILVLTVEY